MIVCISHGGEHQNSKGLHNHITAMQKWTDSFTDKSEKQIRKEFSTLKPIVSKWKFENKDELVLEYEFKKMNILFYFLKKEVITTSVQFLSD